MTEDEACELLVENRVTWMYGFGWWIRPMDGARAATPEESQVLDKVKATVLGQPD